MNPLQPASARTSRRGFLATILGAAVATPAIAKIIANSKPKSPVILSDLEHLSIEASPVGYANVCAYPYHQNYCEMPVSVCENGNIREVTMRVRVGPYGR